MKKFEPELLLKQTRITREGNNLVELEFYGFIVHCSNINNEKSIRTIGSPQNYPFFHRSCAKPLQASLIDDYKTIDFFGLTSEEIAVCCGSHTGERIHLEMLKNLLKKGGLSEKDLKCPTIPPLNNFDELKSFSPLHNNCSGKHALMLLICVQNGWDIENYLDVNHPLQIKMHEKIKTLCELSEETTDLPQSLDGCSAPNWATSLEALSKGFLNLMNFHPHIKDSMVEHPYLLGGKKRLDTHLMQIAPHICAKVGAGGLCVVVNIETNESLVIKLIDADMKARTIITLEALRQLSWVNIDSINTNLLNEINELNSFFDSNIYTQTGTKIGEYRACFDLQKS